MGTLGDAAEEGFTDSLGTLERFTRLSEIFMGYTGEIHWVIGDSLGYYTTLESALESTANEIFYMFAGVT